jgi:uncharacterized membrane protein
LAGSTGIALLPVDATAGRHRAMLAVVGVLTLAVLAGGAALWPYSRPAPALGDEQTDPTRLVSATLTQVATTPCEQAEPGAPGSTCIKVTAKPAGDGEEVSFETTDPTGDTFRPGQRVKLAVLEQPGQPTFYNIRDLERGRPMLALAALFVLAAIAFGRWQWVRSLLGLALSFAVIIGFVVPAILRGRSPVPVALVGALAVMLVSLYLSHGLGRKTTAAVVGTALALGLTAGLADAFVGVASLTGLASEDALNASFQVGGLSLRGLLMAGIIIGGLGVLDDVTVSQASLVFELRRADPEAGFGELVRGALSVGRDHIAATVNTLFLAYAGASLPLLVLFVTGGDSFGTVATAEAVAVEVVRTLCGSIGLVAAVPLTTLLAAALAPPGAGAPEPAWPAAAGGEPLEAPARLAGAGGSATPPDGRSAWSPGRGGGQDEARGLFESVLALHGSLLSHADVGVAGGDRLGREALPADARRAVAQLERLAAAARRSGAPWYRRALAAGTIRLDLRDPGQLELLRCYGPFSTDTSVWVEGDPEPVVETAEALDDLPRVTYRLAAGELERLRGLLAGAGLAGVTLVPKRSSRRPARRH